MGKGVSHDQSRASALCEALERKAAMYQGDEPLVLAKASELGIRAFLPQDLSPFSEEQFVYFDQSDSGSLQNPQWVKRYDPNTPINWTYGRSLNDQSLELH